MALPKSVLLAQPRYGALRIAEAEALTRSYIQVLAQVGVVAEQVGVSIPYIDKSRSAIATTAIDMQRDWEVVVWFDGDTYVTDPRDLVRTLSECTEELPIVGVPYVPKTMGSRAFLGVFEDDIEKVDFYEGGRLYPAKAVPGGCTFVHASLYRAMASKMDKVLVDLWGKLVGVYPFYASAAEGGKVWAPEDYAFCERAKELCGAKIAMDTRPHVKHYGWHGFDLFDAFDTRERPKTVTIELKPKASDDPPKEAKQEPEENAPPPAPQSGWPEVTTTREPCAVSTEGATTEQSAE